jgi:hypothetical protein
MLPQEAKSYFDSLTTRAFADLSIQLASQQKDFERGEFARGQGPGGEGFAARLSELYKASLSAKAQAIVDALKKVHGSFNSPLDADVDAQLRDWGARALSGAYEGLEGAYQRHLQSFGVQLARASGLDYAYALARATVANGPSTYLWELRNVPALQSRPETPSGGVQVTITNNGTIGAVQTGSLATANVQQQWIAGDTSNLRTALAELRAALDCAQDIEPSLRKDVIGDIELTDAELQRDLPNKGRLLRWLGGIGAVIGTVGSVQPAYDAVKDLARALGLPI